MPPFPLYLLAGCGWAACTIGLSLMLVANRQASSLPLWLRAQVAAGQLSLTLYVAHVFLGLGVLEALGHLEQQSAEFALAASLVFCAAAVVVAALIRRRFARGPFEALLRWASSVKSSGRPVQP